MSSKRHGFLIWQGAHIEWFYETFKDPGSFELRPHFKLIATDPKTNESVEWPMVEIQTNEMTNTLKGITDFTELPRELMAGILDNACAKLYEDESLTRLNPFAD